MSKAVKKTFNIDSFLADLHPGKTELKFRAGKSIYKQGDVADAVFYIQEGTVKLAVVSKQGKEAVVAILNHDDERPADDRCRGGQHQR